MAINGSVYYTIQPLRSLLLVGHFFFFFFSEKIPFAGIELTSQSVRRLRGYLYEVTSELPGRL